MKSFYNLKWFNQVLHFRAVSLNLFEFKATLLSTKIFSRSPSLKISTPKNILELLEQIQGPEL